MSENRFWYLLSKKLSGEALPGDLQELQQLLRDHPELVYPAEQVEILWKQEPKTADPLDSELAFENHLAKLQEQDIYLPELQTPASADSFFEPAPGRRGRKKLIAWSLSTVCLLALAFFLWRSGKPAETVEPQEKNVSEVSTKPGSKTRLVLPDSSIVWLNAGSKLTYNEQFGVKNRNATLTGEAYFEVKKTGIPFILQTSSVQIKVLGTAFNVKSYPNEKTTETSLLHGKVEISLKHRPGEKFILKPNEKLIIANEPEKMPAATQGKKEPLVMISNITHLDDSTVIETSWVENKLVFKDESFSDVARKMERWYGVTINFTDESVADYHLYGSFTRETITEALDALKIGFRFSYKIDGDKISIAK